MPGGPSLWLRLRSSDDEVEPPPALSCEDADHDGPDRTRARTGTIALIALASAMLGAVLLTSKPSSWPQGPHDARTRDTRTLSILGNQHFLDACDAGDQHGWPVFHTQADLERSRWAPYFRKVYGEVPEVGYPICLASFKYLYRRIAQTLGVRLGKVAHRCPTATGDLYYSGQGHDPPDSWYIWNEDLASPATRAIPKDHWVEFTHQVYKDDGLATWMYFLPGTGVWFNVGNTKAYLDHQDAVRALLGPNACKDFDIECVQQFPKLYEAARKLGYNSLQFLNHTDMPCGATALEIVDLGGPGFVACGRGGYRAGWRASQPCNCSNHSEFTSCEGYMAER